MIFAFTLKECRRNKAFFLLLALALFSGVIASYIGMRIACSIEFWHMWIYEGDAEFYFAEGVVLLLLPLLLTLSLMTAAFFSIPSSFKHNLKILREQGALRGDFIQVFLILSLIICLPISVLGIGVGELVAKPCISFFVYGEFPFGNAWGAIYRTFLVYLLVAMFAAVIAGIFYHKEWRRKKKEKNTILLPSGEIVYEKKPHTRKIGLKERGKLPVSLGFGTLSFLRRRRPYPLLVCFSLTLIVLFLFGTVFSYAYDFCIELSDKVPFEREISVYTREEYERALEIVGEEEHVSFRKCPAYGSDGHYLCEVLVLPDGEFDALLDTIPHFSEEGVTAILQNFTYGEHMEKIYALEDISEPHSVRMTGDVEVNIIGFINEIVPNYFSSGQRRAFLYMRQTGFPDSDHSVEFSKFHIRYSASSKEETEKIAAQISEEKLGTVKNLHEERELLETTRRIVLPTAILLSPILVLNAILFFAHDLSSRKGEFSALKKMGMGRRQLFFACLFDALWISASLFVPMFGTCAILLKPLHFTIVGSFSPFYIPWQGPVFFALFLLLLSAGYAFFCSRA